MYQFWWTGKKTDDPISTDLEWNIGYVVYNLGCTTYLDMYLWVRVKDQQRFKKTEDQVHCDRLLHQTSYTLRVNLNIDDTPIDSRSHTSTRPLSHTLKPLVC